MAVSAPRCRRHSAFSSSWARPTRTCRRSSAPISPSSRSASTARTKPTASGGSPSSWRAPSSAPPWPRRRKERKPPSRSRRMARAGSSTAISITAPARSIRAGSWLSLWKARNMCLLPFPRRPRASRSRTIGTGSASASPAAARRASIRSRSARIRSCAAFPSSSRPRHRTSSRITSCSISPRLPASRERC